MVARGWSSLRTIKILLARRCKNSKSLSDNASGLNDASARRNRFTSGDCNSTVRHLTFIGRTKKLAGGCEGLAVTHISRDRK